MALYALTSLMPLRLSCADSIGAVSELNGNAQIERDGFYDAALNFGIEQLDNVKTAAGRLKITFLDDSKVSLTEHSELKITKYIFNPDPQKSELALKFTRGTARFVTSQLGKIAKQNIKLSTEVADIAIKGTDFTITIDELNRALLVLLPDPMGLSSGEIEVTTAMGRVVLNQPFQATTVSSFVSMPTPPVILDINLNMIDNMLIVSEPEEEEGQSEESDNRTVNVFLDFNELDLDALEDDSLDQDELEFTELDIDALQVDFLEDLLNVLDSLAVKQEEDQLGIATGIKITGTEIGQDKDTQITTLIQGQMISFRRNVGNSLRLDLDGGNSYTLTISQNNVVKVVTVNGGNDSTINITQQ